MRLKHAISPEDRRRRVIAAAGLVAFGLAIAAVCLFAGKPMLDLLSDPERFRAWVDERGLWGRAAFVGMMAVQIIAAMIPGEPLEIAAGYVFGAAEGTALCLLGALLGGAAVFLAVRRFGRRAVEAFFPADKIDSLPIFRNGRRLEGWLFVVFLFPGTPKDLLTYCAGLTHMRLGRWLTISVVGRIPSVITSTIGGDALGAGSYGFAALVFGVTLLLCGAGLVIYRRMNAREEGGKKHATSYDRG